MAGLIGADANAVAVVLPAPDTCANTTMIGENRRFADNPPIRRGKFLAAEAFSCPADPTNNPLLLNSLPVNPLPLQLFPAGHTPGFRGIYFLA